MGSSLANPYLVLAGTVAAGIDGKISGWTAVPPEIVLSKQLKISNCGLDVNSIHLR